MKKHLLLALISLSVIGCDESAIDPLTGKYPAPEKYEFSTVADRSEVKDDNGFRVFSLKFECPEGSFNANFVADKYYLVPQTYTYSASEGTNGTYFNTTWTAKDGASSQVKSGDIKVYKNDNSYEIKGALTLSDSKVIRIHFKGDIIYEEIIEALRLQKLLSASAQPQENGTNLITIKAGTAGITATPGDYGLTIGGDGNYISIDFCCGSASLEEGTYTPAANGETVKGNFVKGYDTEMWGMTFTNWGTCWFTVANNAATGIHIESGEIVVSKKDNIYTITVNNESAFVEYVGEINL